jgi:hypothetical protein
MVNHKKPYLKVSIKMMKKFVSFGNTANLSDIRCASDKLCLQINPKELAQMEDTAMASLISNFAGI